MISNRRVLDLSSRFGEPEFHFVALMFAWVFHQTRRKLDSADSTSSKLIELAKREGTPGMLVHANFAAGATAVYRGKLHRARARLEQAVAIPNPQPLSGSPQDPRVASCSYLALTIWLLGYPTAAIEMIHKVLSGHSSLTIRLAW